MSSIFHGGAAPRETPEEKSLLLSDLNFENRFGKYDQFVAAKKKAEDIIAQRRGTINNIVQNQGRAASILTGNRASDLTGKNVLNPGGQGSTLR